MAKRRCEQQELRSVLERDIEQIQDLARRGVMKP
jgi:hypothetical protein